MTGGWGGGLSPCWDGMSFDGEYEGVVVVFWTLCWAMKKMSGEVGWFMKGGEAIWKLQHY